MRAALGIAALALAGCGEAPSSPGAPGTAAASGDVWFTDVTDAWGLDFVHDAGVSADKHLPETMGGGGALLDADGDGDLDLYLVQSGLVPTRAVLAASAPRPVNRLYANDGRGALEDVTARSGAAAHDGCGMGVAAGDATGDGRPDLYVTNFGPDVLLVGEGRLAFSDATARAGIADERWTAGAIFFDADADGDLDLFVTAYLDVDVEHPTWCGRKEPGWRSYCHPDHYAGLRDRFWRNAGDGTFADATQEAGLAGSEGKGLGVLAADVDGDRDLDLYVANDSVENALWLNVGGRFEDGTLLSGTGVNARGATEAGMGLACGDVDGDLDLDLIVTNFDHESNTLYSNERAGYFRDVTITSGLEGPSRMPVGFGCVLDDFDQDGRLDLAVANGHIIDNVHLYDESQTHRQRAQLFAGLADGRFRELDEDEAGDLVREPFVGRALLSGDLDGDLDLDLVLVQCGGPARVYRNDAARGGALEVRGLPPGAEAVLELDDGSRLLRTAGPGPTYFGASHPALHAGLGERRVAAIELRYPDGTMRSETFEPSLAGAVWAAPVAPPPVPPIDRE